MRDSMFLDGFRGAAGIALAFGAAIGAASSTRAATPASVTPATLPAIATVDERYQSYNVEMAEVIGGKFWKPYDTLGNVAQAKSTVAGAMSEGSGLQAGQDAAMFQARPPIDLANARLRELAAVLGPLMCA